MESAVKYSVPLITVKGIISQRCKEKFQTRKYGSTSWDPNKFSIHLTRTVMHITINYEVSFEASSHSCRLVGRALCRIYLSLNEVSKLVTGDYFQINDSISKIVHAVKEADFIEAYLCREKHNPITDEFCKRLEHIVTKDYMKQHFRVEEFDVLSSRNISLEDFNADEDNSSLLLLKVIAKYCTHVISENKIYLKLFPNDRYTIMSYCIVHLIQRTENLFSVSVG